MGKTRKILYMKYILTLVFFISLGGGPSIVSAAFDHTFLVNTSSDGFDTNGVDGVCKTSVNSCSLRAAVMQANYSGGTTLINLPAGTYQLTLGAIGIFSNTTIAGAGADQVIIDAQGASRIFEIGDFPFGSIKYNVTISGVSMINGYSNWVGLGSYWGGACVMSWWGNLTLNNITADNCQANNGLGGAISTGWILTLDNSTVSNSWATLGGGGIYKSGGAMTIRNSTISGNSTGAWGGGGIYHRDGGMNIYSSTISFNETIGGTGGGIYESGDTHMGNTIISNNSASSSANCRFYFGLITSVSTNLADDASCSFGLVAPPSLGPLHGNGGPTFTHALPETSPAVDSGNACLATDQRGEPRPTDGDGNGSKICDIGAYELQPFADSDGDTILDGEDNCPTVSNFGQEDLDQDDIGDACDDDIDGDGIQNEIDSQNDVFSDNFSDIGGGGSTDGTIVDRSTLLVTVTDLPNPAGIKVQASGGGGPAEVEACGISHFLTNGDIFFSTCHSLTTKVIEGPVEIHVGIDIILTVPTGAEVTIIEVVTGEFDIENTGSTVSININQDGVEATLDPGQSDTYYSKPVDTDNDGIPDAEDNCPNISNSDQADADGDGIGNACDTCPNDSNNDADSDGVCGNIDNCPTKSNPNQSDHDNDGIGSTCDICPSDPRNDSDKDGICGNLDNCPTTSNSDQKDSDSDGFGDACDACPNSASGDSDTDGVCDDSDQCPGFDDNVDTDSDGIADGCDTCPHDPNNDADSDGVCGDVDNCPSTNNPTQADADSDGYGDVCDVCPNDPDNDTDNDGVCGDEDGCPEDINKIAPGVCGCGEEDIDTDADGTLDCNDGCPTDPDKTEPGENGCGIPENYISQGSDKTVTPLPGITVTFEKVTGGGEVNCSEIPDSSPPANFKFLGYTYQIDFTGTSDGPVSVCFDYDESEVKGDENELKLMHREDENSEWENITKTVDTENNIICGEVTSFSEFAAVEPKSSGGGGSGCFIGTLLD